MLCHFFHILDKFLLFDFIESFLLFFNFGSYICHFMSSFMVRSFKFHIQAKAFDTFAALDKELAKLIKIEALLWSADIVAHDGYLKLAS